VKRPMNMSHRAISFSPDSGTAGGFTREQLGTVVVQAAAPLTAARLLHGRAIGQSERAWEAVGGGDCWCRKAVRLLKAWGA
jgi:hypothetical protein